MQEPLEIVHHAVLVRWLVSYVSRFDSVEISCLKAELEVVWGQMVTQGRNLLNYNTPISGCVENVDRYKDRIGPSYLEQD